MLVGLEERLGSLGYTVTEADAFALGFVSDKVEKKVIDDCGIYDPIEQKLKIPDELHEVTVDMAAGEFLMTKKNIGQLEGFDVDGAIKTISEGDTSVTYQGQTAEQKFDTLVGFLMASGQSRLIDHRKIKW